MKRQAVSAAAPRAPACFPDQSTWVDYLFEAQQGKRPPFKSGAFRNTFNFCNDCTLEHSAQMARADRCTPSTYSVVNVIKQEVAHGC